MAIYSAILTAVDQTLIGLFNFVWTSFSMIFLKRLFLNLLFSYDFMVIWYFFFKKKVIMCHYDCIFEKSHMMS